MVRVPDSWARAGYARYAGSMPNTGGRNWRIPVPPDHLYDKQVTVDLGNDGMAPQITMGGTGTSAGVLNPGTFQTLVSVPIPTIGGNITVSWTVTLAGTVGAPEVNNFQLVLANSSLAFGGFITASTNTGTVGTFVQTAVIVAAPQNSGPLLLQVRGNTPTTGAVYGGSITIPGFGTTVVGPSSGGDLWSLDQCFLQTSVGALDPAQCIVYAGPLPLTQYAVTGSLSGGSSQFGLGGIAVPFGWFVWGLWTNATPGATANLRVTGRKTVLTN